MAAGKSIKVKTLASQFNMTPEEILEELKNQGFTNIKTPMSNIPPDVLELMTEYLEDLAKKKKKEEEIQQLDDDAFGDIYRENEATAAQKNRKRSNDEGSKSHDSKNKNNFRGGNDGGKSRDFKNKNNFRGGKDRDDTNHSEKFQQRGGDKDGNKSAQEQEIGEVYLSSPITVKTLADAIGKRANEVIMKLMEKNILASINQQINKDAAVFVAESWNVILHVDEKKETDATEADGNSDSAEQNPEDIHYESDPKDVKSRPPIVTFMGHVDHGKTSLQDAIRKTHVAAGEAGGITQAIGASVVTLNGKTITFVDTPGHEAFTQMRARGANVTDIVVLVVAADDGFMPQTIEAMNHAKAAGVPIIVAINKMDLPEANPEKVLLNMQQHGLMSEDWGGQIAAIRVSARSGLGISDLLERILLEAEMLELKADYKRPAVSYVLESRLEQGLGPVASVVVKEGSLHVGDPVICGEYFGKVRTLIDHRGKRVAVASPSFPVQVVGLSGVPQAGSKLVVCESILQAKELAEKRAEENRLKSLSSNKAAGTTLEDIFSQMESETRKKLKVIVKADVNGSAEAIVESLKKLPSDKISVEPIHVGVGAITESDITLAASSEAIVVGFHVRVNPGVNDLAKHENVEIRLYSIIYELLEDIMDAMAGRLEPEKREKELGVVRILKIFNLSKGPKICGCRVEKGMAKVGAKARVYRGQELLFNGEVRSLRHFQEDVREIRQGNECGIKLDNFADFAEGDYIHLYEIELAKAKL